jgi:hypothetical protein
MPIFAPVVLMVLVVPAALPAFPMLSKRINALCNMLALRKFQRCKKGQSYPGVADAEKRKRLVRLPSLRSWFGQRYPPDPLEKAKYSAQMKA